MAHNQMLPRSSPESQGVASPSILAFVQAAERHVQYLHSMMLLRHGQVVAEGWWAPCAPDQPHMLFSLTKSFTSTAIGLAVNEGLLTVDDLVLGFFPDQAPATVNEHLAAMRVRHLLSMSTGQEWNASDATMAAPGGKLASGFFSVPVNRVPGTHFVYNSAASQMLAEILHRRTGKTLLEYLRPRLLEPLGIVPADWEMAPSGTNTGGWGLTLKTEDIARFGQLYLRNGQWNGRQLVPESWIAQATSKHVSNGNDPNSDWAQGYGFQFWRCRHGVYRGDGAFGQFCIVMPQLDAVLAMTSGTADMQAVLNLVWEHLLPAMHPASLPANDAAAGTLKDKLQCLTLPPAAGQPASSLRLAGREFRFADGPEQKLRSLALDFSADGCALHLQDMQGVRHQIPLASNRWARSTTSFDSPRPRPVAGSYAWSSDDTWNGRLWFYHTPYCLNLTCRFAGDQVTLEIEQNVTFTPTHWPKQVGHAAKN